MDQLGAIFFHKSFNKIFMVAVLLLFIAINLSPLPATAADFPCAAINCDCANQNAGILSGPWADACRAAEKTMINACEDDPASFEQLCKQVPGANAWPTEANKHTYPEGFDPGLHPAAAIILALVVAAVVAIAVLALAPLIIPAISAVSGVGLGTFLTSGIIKASIISTLSSGLFYTAVAAGGISVGAKILTSTNRLSAGDVIQEAGLTAGSVAIGGGLLKTGPVNGVLSNAPLWVKGLAAGVVTSAPKAAVEVAFTDKSLSRGAVDVALGGALGGVTGKLAGSLTSNSQVVSKAMDAVVDNTAALFGGSAGNTLDAAIHASDHAYDYFKKLGERE